MTEPLRTGADGIGSDDGAQPLHGDWVGKGRGGTGAMGGVEGKVKGQCGDSAQETITRFHGRGEETGVVLWTSNVGTGSGRICETRRDERSIRRWWTPGSSATERRQELHVRGQAGRTRTVLPLQVRWRQTLP